MESLEHIEKMQNYIDEFTMKGEINSCDLVQFFEQNNCYMSLKTVTQYAKDNNISYNGAKKCRKVITLFGVKFIQDND